MRKDIAFIEVDDTPDLDTHFLIIDSMSLPWTQLQPVHDLCDRFNWLNNRTVKIQKINNSYGSTILLLYIPVSPQEKTLLELSR